MTATPPRAGAGHEPQAPADPRLAEWRADTPGVAHHVHLNNAGSALMPRSVLDAMTSHLELESMRGGYEAADSSQSAVSDAYEAFAQLIGARARNIAMVPSATAGFVRALSAFDFEPDDIIVTSRSDYTSNQIQYLALARRRGVRVERAADLPEGGVDPDDVRARCRAGGVRLVALSWVPTNSGLVQDAHAVGSVCREHGVPYLLDACQAIGQIPIDVEALACDYLSVTARKFLRGPRGMGAMFVSDAALARGDYPLYVDMRGAAWSDADAFELADGGRRFEEWEQPYALLLGLGAASRYALDVGIDVAHARSWALADRARAALSEVPGVRVLDRGRERCAIVTFAVAGAEAATVVHELHRRGVYTSHSAGWVGLIDFADKGVEGAVRLSPHYYNTEDELDAAIGHVREIASAHKG